MKTTIDFPDSLLRKAKARAAERGVSLRQFVTEPLEGKVSGAGQAAEKPWMQAFGGLRHFRKENLRIPKIIDEEFGQLPEDRDCLRRERW